MVKASILKASQKDAAVIRLRYENESEEEYDGVVVQVTKKIVVLACMKDFEFDGYHVLLRNRIKGYRNSKYEKCYTQIISHNGQLSRINPPQWVQAIQGVESAIRSMKRYRIWPAIETIYNSEGAFSIGPITSISNDTFGSYCYDAEGIWEKEYELGFADVIRLEWSSKYCNHFNKYMRATHNKRL